MKFQEVFRKTNPAGDNIVFEKIWSNTNLKNDLWKPADYPSGITETQAKNIFIGWISNVNNLFYNFIKVK